MQFPFDYYSGDYFLILGIYNTRFPHGQNFDVNYTFVARDANKGRQYDKLVRFTG